MKRKEEKGENEKANNPELGYLALFSAAIIRLTSPHNPVLFM